MKKLLSRMGFVSLLALAVGACGLEDPADEGELGAAQTAESSAAVQAAATGHWYLVSLRNCLTDFNTVCSDTVPAKQCVDPDANPGTSCPKVGVGCNRVLGATGYQVLKCI